MELVQFRVYFWHKIILTYRALFRAVRLPDGRDIILRRLWNALQILTGFSIFCAFLSQSEVLSAYPFP